MQIIKNIEQGTKEWLSLKLGVASASNFNKIITSKGEESDQLKGYALSSNVIVFIKSKDIKSYANCFFINL